MRLQLRLTLGILCSLVATARAGTERPRLLAHRADEPIRIDGRLREGAWQAAAENAAFTQKFPREGQAPTERTALRVLYDDEALYVGFDCTQRRTPVTRRLTRRDREAEADWVEVSLDTRRDGTSAFTFRVNAAAVLLDGIRFNDTDFSAEWDENWEAAAALTEHGWAAELRIPLRVLRFDAVPEQEWGLQARRYVSGQQETDEWAFTPRSQAGEVSHYGRLAGLRGLRNRRPIELRPFAVGRLRLRDPVPDILDSGLDFYGSAGLDLKWHITQNLTLDATINPDFGQVEADQVVLNLTTYEILFPEKRPFFLEGIDTFHTPLMLLYTRRIGHAPDAPDLQGGEQLHDAPEPTTIYGAAKLLGTVGRRLTVGALSALTADNRVLVRRPDRSDVARWAEPLTSYNVLRVKLALGDNGHLGVLGTAATRFGGAGYHDAYVGGIDGRWRSAGGTYVATGQAVLGGIVGGPPRTLPDGTVLGSGDLAPGADLRLAKEGGKNVLWEVGARFAGRKLDINDLGFLERQNLLDTRAILAFRTLQPFGRVQDSYSRVAFFDQENLGGLTVGRTYLLNTWWKFRNFWEFFAEIHYFPARFDDREVGDGTALMRAPLVGLELAAASDRRRRFYFDLFTQNQLIDGGYRFYLEAILTFRLLPQLDLDLLPQALYTFGEPRYAAAGEAPGSYLFGRLLAKEAGATLRATYTFTPRLTLQVYAQLLLASKHYGPFFSYRADPARPLPALRLRDLHPAAAPAQNPDFEEAALNINAVLRWEFQPGSTLFVVYTRSQAPSVLLPPGQAADLDPEAIHGGRAANAVLLKLSYWWG